MTPTPELLRSQLDAHQPLWLALSGGLDSMVLLQLLCDTGLSFRAIHVNHQLSPNADAWERHCREACEQRQVPLTVKRVEVALAGQGLEAAARQARYQAFAECLGEGDQLLTAHHRDDQAETLLLRLLRGAGPTGLAGIRSRQTYDLGGRQVWLLRPLLGSGRADLEAAARDLGLNWVEDESNADAALDRNYLRAEILPRLASRWPAVAERLAGTAALCADNQALIDELAAGDLQTLVPSPPVGMGWSLPLAPLVQMTEVRRTNLLRFWLARWPLQLEQVQLQALWQQVAHAADDARVRLQFGRSELRRYDGRLWLLPGQVPAPTQPSRLAPGETLAWGNGRVWLEARDDGLALPADGAFRLSARAGGERAHPAGRGHSQSLKKLLQAAGLAPWLRDQLPLVYQGEQLCAVGDLWCETGARRSAQGYRICWQLPQNPWPF